MRAQLNKLILATVLSLVTAPVLADSPAFPTPRVIVSERADTYFAQVPDFSAPEAGSGVAYRLNDDGTSEELWRVNGWYAFEAFLANDGRHLVRIGPWAVGQEPEEADLAAAFYRNGVELKRHSTADLIKSPSSVKRSVSHYQWMNRDSGYPRLAGNSFYLETVEGRVLEFDVTTGMMVGEGAKR